MTHAVWLAHGGVQDAGPVLIMLVPAGFLYGIGLILCLSPVISAMNKPPKSESEKLATEMLGEDEAKEQAQKARRLRSIRRREVKEAGEAGEVKEAREVAVTGPRRDDGGWRP